MARENQGGIRRAVDYRIDARIRAILIREFGAIIRGGKVQAGGIAGVPGGSADDILTDDDGNVLTDADGNVLTDD